MRFRSFLKNDTHDRENEISFQQHRPVRAAPQNGFIHWFVHSFIPLVPSVRRVVCRVLHREVCYSLSLVDQQNAVSRSSGSVTKCITTEHSTADHSNDMPLDHSNCKPDNHHRPIKPCGGGLRHSYPCRHESRCQSGGKYLGNSQSILSTWWSLSSSSSSGSVGFFISIGKRGGREMSVQ